MATSRAAPASETRRRLRIKMEDSLAVDFAPSVYSGGRFHGLLDGRFEDGFYEEGEAVDGADADVVSGGGGGVRGAGMGNVEAGAPELAADLDLADGSE